MYPPHQQWGYDPRFFYPPNIAYPPPRIETGISTFFKNMKDYEDFVREWEERQKKKEDEKKKSTPKKPDNKVDFSTALLMTLGIGPFVAAANYWLWKSILGF